MPRKTPPYESRESRASEALTVAWSLSVMTVLVCSLMAIVVHWYGIARPEVQRMPVLEELLLLAGSIIGLVSLTLLPFLFRIRRRPAPSGLVAFGVLVAIAPLLTVLLRLLD